MPEHAIEVTFAHRTRVLRRRGRDARNADFEGSMVVTVEEPSADEAPVAIRFHVDDDPLEVRVHAGRFLCRADRSPTMRQVQGAPSAPVGVDWISSEARYFPDRTSALGVRSPASRATTLTRLDDDPSVREVLHRDDEEVADLLRRRLARFVVVDGIVWTEVPEPVVILDRDGDAPRAWVAFAEQPSTPGYSLTEVDAIAGIEGIAVPVEEPRFEVVRPELLIRPMAGWTAIQVGTRLTELMRHQVGRMTEEREDACLELLRELESARVLLKDHGACDLVALAALVDRTCAAYEREVDAGASDIWSEVDRLRTRVAILRPQDEQLADFAP